MPGRVEGKVALVTGGASGLGAASVRMLVREGARVAITDLNEAGGQALAQELGEATRFWRLDVTREEDWSSVVDAVLATFGRLDVVVNNAGMGIAKDVETLSLQEWRLVHAVNGDGVFLGCKHGVGEIKKHTHKLGGSVINISSISGIIAGANMAAYNSAKAGVRLLSKSVALHCAKSGYNIRCNSVHPTFIDTPILDRYRDRFGNEVMQQKLGRQVPIGRLGRPEEVGWALVFLASDESSFMTGSEVVIDGGISAM